jgi:hypothetical protein
VASNGLDLQVMFRNADGSIPSSLLSEFHQRGLAGHRPNHPHHRLRTDSGPAALMLDDKTNVYPSDRSRVSLQPLSRPLRAEAGDRVQRGQQWSVFLALRIH